MTENKDKWKKYVHGVVSPRIEDEQNREWNGRKMVVILPTVSKGMQAVNVCFNKSYEGTLTGGAG